jgi:DNA-directed RNA polymerase III subunit RPC1
VLEKQTDSGTIRLALHVMKDREARKRIARELQIGDVVHRHVRDEE